MLCYLLTLSIAHHINTFSEWNERHLLHVLPCLHVWVIVVNCLICLWSFSGPEKASLLFPSFYVLAKEKTKPDKSDTESDKMKQDNTRKTKTQSDQLVLSLSCFTSLLDLICVSLLFLLSIPFCGSCLTCNLLSSQSSLDVV